MLRLLVSVALDLAAEFEKACTLMGIKEQEAAKQALEDTERDSANEWRSLIHGARTRLPLLSMV
jgi:predicted secreted protein